jgi:hypothetical protein
MTATGWRGRERTLHFVFLIFQSDKKTRWLTNEVSAERYRFPLAKGAIDAIN